MTEDPAWMFKGVREKIEAKEIENQENGLTVTKWATPVAPAFSLLLFGKRPCCQRAESGRHLLGLLATHTEGVGAGTGACRTHPFSEWGPGILNAGGGGSRSSCSSHTRELVRGSGIQSARK